MTNPQLPSYSMVKTKDFPLKPGRRQRFSLLPFLFNIVSKVLSTAVQFSCLVVSDSLWLHWMLHTRLLCSSPTPRACSNTFPSSWWCHTTVSFSVICFSSCLQSFPAPGSFPVSQFFASGGQRIGVSASASVLPMNIQDWFSLSLTGLTSFLSKGLSTVVSNTTVQKKQFFSAQVSLWSNSHIHTWLIEKP